MFSVCHRLHPVKAWLEHYLLKSIFCGCGLGLDSSRIHGHTVGTLEPLALLRSETFHPSSYSALFSYPHATTSSSPSWWSNLLTQSMQKTTVSVPDFPVPPASKSLKTGIPVATGPLPHLAHLPLYLIVLIVLFGIEKLEVFIVCYPSSWQWQFWP